MAHLISPASPASALSWAERFRQSLMTFRKHRKDQRIYGHMLSMSNRELADMGLTRQDVRDAMAHTFTRPGTH